MSDEYNEFENEDFEKKEEREALVEDDEISAAEEGFMDGESGGGKNAKCANCGVILMDGDSIIERDIEGEHHFFHSEKCAEEYAKKHVIE